MYNHHGVQPLSDAVDAARYFVADNCQTEPPLPAAYGRQGVTLLVRDPHWVFAFWESHTPQSQLEVYNTDQSGQKRELVAATAVEGIGARYVHVPYSGSHYVGYLSLPGEESIESAVVATPPDAPSDVFDEAWMSIEALQHWLRNRALPSSPGIAPLLLPEHR